MIICVLWSLVGLTACTNILKAVNSGRVADVQAAIARGEDVNRRDDDGNTPLILAAKHGDLEITMTLVSKGADLKAKNKDGDDALLALTNYTMVSSPSVTKGSAVSEPIGITTQGHMLTAEYLIQQGVNVNAKNNDGNTVLILAVQLNKKALVGLYLNNGAYVNASNKQGYTALIVAAMKGNSEFICPLLAKGANMNAMDNEGKIALQYAEQNGHQKIAQLIVSGCPKGGSVDERSAEETSGKVLEKKMAAEQEVDKLIDSLRAQDPYVRREAARKLGELKEKRAVAPLIGAMKDDDPYVRRRAAVALGNIGDLRAVESLIQTLNDSDSFVQTYSIDALTTLSGQRFGSDAKLWQEWWNQKIRQN